ncbi:ABC transporter substrate-binding protein [Paenibacillus agaridevorans]|uniref:ABC transporter substrate-binding protein n=1 Tax=Paenibacillus agaridevorans TaxID=171404 RepID=UPI001BE49197|nr:extracellular solute-binding protein [Paenibacillus agaridevorans]
MTRNWKASTALLAISTMLLASACGNSGTNNHAGNSSPAPTNTTSSNAEGDSASEEPVKLKLLTISSDQARQTIMNEYIKANLANELPGVEVEYEETSDVGAKMKVYNASGELPDVFWSGADYATAIINAGNQLNLEPNITENGFIEKFAVKEALTYKDGIYTLNSGADTYFTPKIFYHKDIFEKHQIEIPTTFDELVAASEKLLAAGIQPISAPGKGGWAPAYFMIQNMIQIEDPSVAQDLVENKIDFTHPVVKNALNRIVTLAEMGAFGQGAANVDYGPAKEAFTQNKAAMYMIFSWELADLEANVPDVGFFSWPSASDNYKPGSAVQFWGSPLAGYAVSAKSENIEKAVELAQFLAEQDAKYFSDTGSQVTLDIGATSTPAPLMQANIDEYNQAGIKIPSLSVMMDPKTAAEYSNFSSLLMTGDYTADDFIQDFNDLWLKNTYFE